MTDAEKDAAKIYILEHAEDVFEKWTGRAKKRINGKNSYICPFCGNGSGESGTGIAWNPKAKSGNEWTCFLCNRSGDIFDYWIEKNNLDPRRDFPKAIEQIAGFMGYSFLSGTGKAYYSPAEIAALRAEIEEKSRAREKEIQEKQEKDAGTIKKELDAARRKLVENPNGLARKYLEKRGFKYFDEIFSDKYGLGYLDNWEGHGARLIIKTGESSYFCRDIRDEIPENEKRFEKMSIGRKSFYNLPAIWESDSPVIVVEGEIDALSLISLNKGDVGALERVEAVALGSISMINKFAEICAENPPKAPLIIALDNDDAGRRAEGELLNLLHDAKIPAIGINIAGKCKDVNEALQEPNGDTDLLLRVAIAKSRARMFSFSPIKKESTIQPEGTDAAGAGELVDVTEMENPTMPENIDETQSPKSSKLGFTRGRDFAATMRADQWLIHHWIPAHGLSMLFGDSGAGKSFVILDMALHIAAGRESWHGKRVTSGTVVYIAGEGQEGLKKRFNAWRQEEGEKPYEFDPDIYFSARGIDLNTDEGTQSTIDEIKALNTDVSLIVVDTLARNMRGDENSAQDAGEMVNSCGLLQSVFNCAVVLIHHTGVAADAKNRSRGSSAWLGALDTQIQVTSEKPVNSPTVVTLKQMKQKDIYPEKDLKLDFRGVELLGWTEEDGHTPLTSAILVDHVERFSTKNDVVDEDSSARNETEMIPYE